MFGKGIKKDNIEVDFVNRLAKITPKKKVLPVILENLMDVWREKGKSLADSAHRRAEKLAELEAKKKRIYEMREDGSYTKDDFLERMEEIKNMIATEKASISEVRVDQYDMEELLLYADHFADNLGRQWLNLPPQVRPRFQKFVFPEGIIYEKENGFGTANMASILELFEQYDGQKSTVVAHCVDCWNQIIKELKEWRELQETINADSLTQIAA